MYLTEVNEIEDEVLRGLIVGSLSLYFISSTSLSHDDYQHILFGVGFLKFPPPNTDLFNSYHAFFLEQS